MTRRDLFELLVGWLVVRPAKVAALIPICHADLSWTSLQQPLVDWHPATEFEAGQSSCVLHAAGVAAPVEDGDRIVCGECGEEFDWEAAMIDAFRD